MEGNTVVGEPNHIEDKKVYICPNCGANMTFNIKSQNLKCDFCEFEMDIVEDKEIKEYDFTRVEELEKTANWGNEVSVVQCDSCGAETVVPANGTAVICSFCGSSHVLPSQQNSGIKPEAVLPFKIQKNEAMDVFNGWIKKKFFAPNDLKLKYEQGGLNSVYVPYWTYDAETYSHYTGEGGEYYYVTVRDNEGKTHRERKVRWYRTSGNVNKFFDDVQVNASKNFNDSLMQRIEPYDTRALVPYKPEFISGYIAERYSKGVKSCFELAKVKMADEIRDLAKDQILARYDTYRIHSVNTNHSDVKYKHVLLPIWTSHFVYNNKNYTFMVNGQNGKISGECPISAIKVTIAVIIVVILAIVFITVMNN